MQVFKKHIALLLLVGFLLPQVLSGMHYLVVSHRFSSEINTTYKKANPDLQYHSCHYFLSSFSSVLPSESRLRNIDFKKPPAILSFYSFENYVHQKDFNFQLRGPPVITISVILNTA